MSRHNEVIFGRSQRLRVFVSSEMRSGKLNDARFAVAEAIEESGWHDAWFWERDGHAGPFSSRPICIGNAETSDYLILILGETLTDITRDEYLAAKAAGVAVIIFMPLDCERDEAANVFFAEEAMSVTFGRYGSPADLKTRVLSALQNHAVRALRERQLARQMITAVSNDLSVGTGHGEA